MACRSSIALNHESLIGAVDMDGKPITTSEGIAPEDALKIPDSHLRVVPNCMQGKDWNFGYVDCCDNDTSYLVSHSTNVMVESESLAILSLATSGRMTPERLWTMAIRGLVCLPLVRF